MIINDLSHVETILENEKIQGGLAVAEALSDAFADGSSLAITSIFAYTESFASKTFSSSISSAGSTSVAM